MLHLRAEGTSSRKSLAAAGLLALFIAVVGFAPHIWFSARLGELTFFKSAYDEDAYARLTLLGEGRGDRVLAATLFKGLYVVCGRNLTTTLAIADASFPALAALSAFVLAAVVARGTSSRLLIALLLLFGQELFSFGSTAVTWLLPEWLSLSRARQALAASHPGLVPDYYTSYFSLFRTPEPQVTLCLVFLHLAGVLALVSGRGRRYRPWLLAALTASHAVLVYEYAFLVALVVAMEGLLVLTLMGVGRWGQAGWLLVTMMPLGGLGVFGGWASASSQFMFHSPAPILTPAVMYSALLLLAVTVVRWRGVPFNAPALCITAACAAVPLLLMNQQIVTGVMVSTRDFERYSNYPALVLGAAVLATAVGPPRWLAAAIRPLLAGSIAGLGLVVTLGQWTTVDQFRNANEASVAMARAIRTAVATEAAPPRVLVAEVELVPLVAVRLHGRAHVEFVLDYTETLRRVWPRFEAEHGDERRSADFHGARLFEYFARSGLSVVDVKNRLRGEAGTIGTGSALLLHFLFHRFDVWYPDSDSRKLRPEFVRAALPQIVDRYARFLAHPPEILERPVLYVARREESLPGAGTTWFYRLLAEATGSAGPAYVAYVQSPHPVKATGR